MPQSGLPKYQGQKPPIDERTALYAVLRVMELDEAPSHSEHVWISKPGMLQLLDDLGLDEMRQQLRGL